jgi:hypothetical protein
MRSWTMKSVVFCLLIISSYGGWAQTGQSRAKALLEEAKGYMAKEDYRAADKKFRQILSLNEVVPTEALYFFAFTLEKNHQLQSSRNFLNKYTDLTGKSGEYFNEARMLQNRLDVLAREIEACDYCDNDGFRLVTCGQCDGSGHVDDKCPLCHGFGEITCHKCLGEGVQISKNQFGENVYKTCDVCAGKGKETCTQCRGEKHVVQDCPRCHGLGRSGSDLLCNHKEHFIIPSMTQIKN